MKTLSWIFAIIAIILIILAAIDVIFNPAFLPYKVVNYFHVANTFLLLTICCWMFFKEKHSK